MLVKSFLPVLCLSFTPFLYALPMNFHHLAKQCAPDVSSHTLAAIVKTESGFNPYAIGVNKGKKLSKQPSTYQEDVYTAKSLLSQGVNIDIEMAQINSANLAMLNMTVAQLFDPCMNLKASALILRRNYQAAKKIYGEGQKALQAALSAYNTGSFSRGFNNGYVRKVLANARSNTTHVILNVPKLEPHASTKLAKPKTQTKGEQTPQKNLLQQTSVQSIRENQLPLINLMLHGMPSLSSSLYTFTIFYRRALRFFFVYTKEI